MVFLNLVKTLTPNSDYTDLKHSLIDYAFFLIPLVYIWSLPIISKLNFSEGAPKQFGYTKNAWSVSQYIASPPATGAMALCYFYINVKMILLHEKKCKAIDSNTATLLRFFRFLYILFFNIFLIATYTYVPIIHGVVVGIFMIAFILHSISFIKLARKYKNITNLTSNLLIGEIILGVGILSAVIVSLSLPNIIKGVAYTQKFWFFECVGLTAMPLFTLVSILTINSAEAKDKAIN